MFNLILAFGGIAGLLFLIVFAYGWENVWEQAAGPADMGAVTFENLGKTPNPNQALICPDGLCKDKERDRKSPVYAISADELLKVVLKVVNEEAGVERADNGAEPMALRYVARSRMFRFPDTIRIQIFPLGNGRSTLALYSQSQIGRSDFGVNLRRVDRWLGQLKRYEIATTADHDS